MVVCCHLVEYEVITNMLYEGPYVSIENLMSVVCFVAIFLVDEIH